MLAKQLQGAALATIPQYIEDVFSTYLYNGASNTALQIQNGIDLSTKGGMVWIKCRSNAVNHYVLDTARGVTSSIQTNATNAAAATPRLGTFNTDGFTHSATPTNSNLDINETSRTFASWTFRKQAKFFDVVTYTGNGTNRTISHNLGSVPGTIIIKRTDTTAAWAVYHRSLANTEYLVLNTTAAKATGATYWNSTTPTSTEFSLGTATEVNASGGSATYVAYLFAHDAGGFGLTGTDNVISCGSFTTNGSGAATIDLGYEPQWCMVKCSTMASSDWQIRDNMRGWVVGGTDARIYANTSGAETLSDQGNPTATGFTVSGMELSQTYIYIAIRRGPMRTPTSGTSVYEPVAYTGNNTTQRQIGSTVLLDALLLSCRTANSTSWGTYAHYMGDRLRGVNVMLATSRTDAESGGWTTYFDYDTNVGWDTGSAATQTYNNATGSTFISHAFRRAPGFFDVVCYTGNGSSSQDVNHNLGVAPELIIVKGRNAALAGTDWFTYAAPVGNTKYMYINGTPAPITSASAWSNTTPSATTFRLGGNTSVNSNGGLYIAYLFATVAGVSKVGSYTGNGTSLTVPCGFTAGARFIMIKRTDSTGDWYVWDTARGIVSGNDPHLSLNTTGGDVTTDDTIDPDNSGFIVNQVAATNVNVNNATYIFLAIA